MSARILACLFALIGLLSAAGCSAPMPRYSTEELRPPPPTFQGAISNSGYGNWLR
jgi:hypothetical protein